MGKPSNEDYKAKKITEYRQAMKEREEMRPSLEAKYKRWSDNCESCNGKVVGCNSPVHF